MESDSSRFTVDRSSENLNEYISTKKDDGDSEFKVKTGISLPTTLPMSDEERIKLERAYATYIKLQNIGRGVEAGVLKDKNEILLPKAEIKEFSESVGVLSKFAKICVTGELVWYKTANEYLVEAAFYDKTFDMMFFDQNDSENNSDIDDQESIQESNQEEDFCPEI